MTSRYLLYSVDENLGLARDLGRRHSEQGVLQVFTENHAFHAGIVGQQLKLS